MQTHLKHSQLNQLVKSTSIRFGVPPRMDIQQSLGAPIAVVDHSHGKNISYTESKFHMFQLACVASDSVGMYFQKCLALLFLYTIILYYRIKEWFGLEKTLKSSSYNSLPWAETLQVAQSPIQPGLDHFSEMGHP